MNDTVGIDDVYPENSTAFFLEEPQEQKQERKKEEGKNWAGKEQIEEIVERLEARIKYFNSPQSIDVDIKDSPEVHQKKVFVSQGMSEELDRELDYWRGKLMRK